MSCEKYSNWSVLYLYDELNAADREEFEAHRRICPQCQAEFAALQEAQTLVQHLSLEEIAPVAIEQLIPVKKPGVLEQFLHPVWAKLKWAFQSPRRFVLVSAMVTILLLMLFYRFSPELNRLKIAQTMNQETALEWDAGLKDSLIQLDQKIAQVNPENLSFELDGLSETTDNDFTENTDTRLQQLETEIQSLSNELTQLTF